MGGRWKPGVVIGHEETPQSFRNRGKLTKSTESAPLSPGESQRKCTDQAHQTTPSGKKHTSRSFEQEASHLFDEEISASPKKQVEEL